MHQIGLDAVRRLRSGGLPLSMAIADPLLAGGNLEEGMAGTQIVGALARLISGADFERFDKWAGSLTNAQTADALGTGCIGPAMAATPSLALKLLDWAKSPSPWRRRAAVAAFVPLVREGRFLTDAISVAELLMEDSHEDVQRGVGTMFLEASRLQAPRVVEFLASWKHTSPTLLLQVAATKLSQADRAAVLDG